MKLFFLFFVVFVIIQWYLKIRQIRAFYKHYNSFLQEGDVLIGRQKGMFSGAIIIMKLDEKGNIQECMLVHGASFFAKFKSFQELNHKNILQLKEDHYTNYKRSVRKAVKNAVTNYYKKRNEVKQEL